MRNQRVTKLVYTALFTALTCVATMVIQIPSPMNGYLNLGDAFVLLSAWFLGPVYGLFAGGVGSMLADLLSGYAYYAPGTLIIKGLMAFVAAVLFRTLRGRDRGRGLAEVVSGVLAECVMVTGYFAYALLLLGKGLAAAGSIPGNLIQAGVGVIAAATVSLSLRHVARLPEPLRRN